MFKYLPELVEDEDESDEETPDHIDCEDENDSDNEGTEVEWNSPKEPLPTPIHIRKFRPLYKISNPKFPTLEPEEEEEDCQVCSLREITKQLSTLTLGNKTKRWDDDWRKFKKEINTKEPLILELEGEGEEDYLRHFTFNLANLQTMSPEEMAKKAYDKEDIRELDDYCMEAIPPEILKPSEPKIPEGVYGSEEMKECLRLILTKYVDVFSKQVRAEPARLSPLVIDVDKKK